MYNRNRINKTTIIYTTLSFMFPQFSSIILMLSKISCYQKYIYNVYNIYKYIYNNIIYMLMRQKREKFTSVNL